MSKDQVTVCLARPAKVLGKFRKRGDVLAVDPDTARQMSEAGLLKNAPAELAADAAGIPGFDEAVRTAAKTLAESVVEAAVEGAMEDLTAEKNAALARAVEAEAQRDALQERVLELQAEIEALKAQGVPTSPTEGDDQTSPTTEIPPAEQAAKTAPKKGTAAKKG